MLKGDLIYNPSGLRRWLMVQGHTSCMFKVWSVSPDTLIAECSPDCLEYCQPEPLNTAAGWNIEPSQLSPGVESGFPEHGLRDSLSPQNYLEDMGCFHTETQLHNLFILCMHSKELI